jgi:hypothetical protein
MFSDARRAGLIERNPFLGLGLSTGPGRKNIKMLTLGQVLKLADAAAATWGKDGYGQVWRALVLWQAFVGTRRAEAYGLVRGDLDIAAADVDIWRQRTPYTPRDAALDELPLPKNGQPRRIVIPPPALDAIQALPRPIDLEAPLFGTRRGRPLSGQVQHYYWHPVRSAFGNASLDLYELRHFCASYMLNDLDLHAEDVAAQLGHTDGGVLVQRLYATRRRSWPASARTKRIGGQSCYRCARPRSSASAERGRQRSGASAVKAFLKALGELDRERCRGEVIERDADSVLRARHLKPAPPRDSGLPIARYDSRDSLGDVVKVGKRPRIGSCDQIVPEPHVVGRRRISQLGVGDDSPAIGEVGELGNPDVDIDASARDLRRDLGGREVGNLSAFLARHSGPPLIAGTHLVLSLYISDCPDSHDRHRAMIAATPG